MKKLSNIETELKKSIAYKKSGTYNFGILQKLNIKTCFSKRL